MGIMADENSQPGVALTTVRYTDRYFTKFPV